MKSSINSVELNAAAIQDHISRNFSLNNYCVNNNKLNKKQIWKKTKLNGTNIDYEYVIEKETKLTLAERLGIVEGANYVITETEWAAIKQKAIDRKDFLHPCVICKENLGNSLHVILSCSHVFHKNCIQAFERFIGHKSCPLCRQKAYKTRIVHDAKHFYRHRCAIVIQSLWRGYAVRKLNLKNKILPFNSDKRKKYFQEKLSMLSDKILTSTSYDIDAFICNINKNLLQYKKKETPHYNVQWDFIKEKALKRKNTNCPICLLAVRANSISRSNIDNKYCFSDDETKMLNGTNSSEKNNLFILSCSHILHKTCLENLEKYVPEERQNMCPVCRSSYIKILM